MYFCLCKEACIISNNVLHVPMMNASVSISNCSFVKMEGNGKVSSRRPDRDW